MNRDEILDELVGKLWPLTECFGPTFEVLEDYWAIADTRLSVFAGERSWATIFELVVYDGKADEFRVRVWVLGNHFKTESDETMSDFERELFFIPPSWNPSYDDEKRGLECFSREKIALLHRGQRHEFSVSDAQLQAANIELTQRQTQTNALSHAQLLRFLCEHWSHPFFLSEDALRDLMDSRAPEYSWEFEPQHQRSFYRNPFGDWETPPLPSFQFELLLQTRNWQHPLVCDLEESEAETKIREAMGSVADLIATRDLSAWHAQNPATFNSDWRIFADYEAKEEREWQQKIEEETEKFRARLAELSPEERAAILPILAEQIATFPSLREFCQQGFIEWQNREIRVFAELKTEIEALLRQTPPN